jgi:L,D-transpeptidase ErfK/SrfK
MEPRQLHRFLLSVLLLKALLLTLRPPSIRAETFLLSEDRESVVGQIRYTRVIKGETLVDIARQTDLGYDQIILANPRLNRWVPEEGARVKIPNMYVLPGTARRGIVLNIAELRLYYYPPSARGASKYVITHPVSIGRMDWRTPLGQTKVVSKERDPAWRPTHSIRTEHELDGDELPDYIPGGDPENPLGRFALRLGIRSYLIHGVNESKEYGIGMRVTHGCIRMYPEDIEPLFSQVSIGTPVLIINEPIKLGRRGERIFLEVHQPLEESDDGNEQRISSEDVLDYVNQRVSDQVTVDDALITQVARRGDGVPVDVGG